MLNECILIGIDETKSTKFDFMRNAAPQDNLVRLLKYLAESIDNLKFEETKKVAIFILPNSYILHCYGECSVFISKEMA